MNPVVAGRFELLEPIGSGGVAEVHRARDRRTGALVAVKQLLPQLTADRAVSRRFLREAEAARALDHPGIVRVLEAGEADGRPYLAMELIEGEDLRRRLDRQGPLPWPEAHRIARTLAGALAHAHDRGVIHRDVKPHNVLMAGEAIKLADFGLARVETLASLTGSSLVWGSPEYMAPELFGRGRADPRTDLFSLGVVLFEMVTGRLPWKDRSLARLMTAVTDAPPPLPSLGQGASIDRLVAALLSPAPAQRPATAGEVIAALDGSDRTALVAQVPCGGCGALRPGDVPRCFACGHTDLAVEHTPGGQWAVRLKTIADDAASMDMVHRALGAVTGRTDLRLTFVVGSGHLYSRKEKKAAIALPALLFDDLDEPAAREVARGLASSGLNVAAGRRHRSLRSRLGRGTMAMVLTASFGVAVTMPFVHAAGIPYVLTFGLLAGLAAASRRAPLRRALFRLAGRRPPGPAAERLLGEVRQRSTELAAPEVRSLFVEVARELYRLAHRAEELAQASPSGSSEEALARRLLAAAPSLSRRLDEIARRLETLDATLSADSESETLRALAAVERALPAAPPQRRAQLEQTRRDLEATSQHRRAVEGEREQLAANLCRMLAAVRDLYRRARSLRSVQEHEAQAIAEALAELETSMTATEGP